MFTIKSQKRTTLFYFIIASIFFLGCSISKSYIIKSENNKKLIDYTISSDITKDTKVSISTKETPHRFYTYTKKYKSSSTNYNFYWVKTDGTYYIIIALENELDSFIFTHINDENFKYNGKEEIIFTGYTTTIDSNIIENAIKSVKSQDKNINITSDNFNEYFKFYAINTVGMNQSNKKTYFHIINLCLVISILLVCLTIYEILMLLKTLNRADRNDIEKELNENQNNYKNLKIITTKNYIIFLSNSLKIFNINELEHFCIKKIENTRSNYYSIDIIDNKKKSYRHNIYTSCLIQDTLLDKIEELKKNLTDYNYHINTDETNQEYKKLEKNLSKKNLISKIILFLLIYIVCTILINFII